MDNEKEVRFDLYCDSCAHWHIDGKYNQIIDKVVFEEYVPCCYCINTPVREGTMVPEYWKEK